MRTALIFALCLCLAAPVGAHVVSEDTVWTGAQDFAEDVQVLAGVKLTVASGAVIRFANARFEIAGQLIAHDAEFSGENWSGLILTNREASITMTECLIRGAETGIYVQGGAPKLERLTLLENRVGVEIRGKAGGSVEDSTFVDNSKVGLFIKDDSTTTVVGCRFEKNGRFGAYLYRARPQSFRDNVFLGNAVGLMISYHGSDPLVEANRFSQNEIGVQVDRAARPVLRGNELEGNRTGLYAYRRSDPLVAGNRFRSNDVGIKVAYSSYPQIKGNDFMDNAMALLLEFQSSSWEALRGAETRKKESTARSAFSGRGMRHVSEDDRRANRLDGTIDAKDNWWGPAGTAELASLSAGGNPTFIFDGRDQATFVDAGTTYPLDKVKFTPWSKVPVAENRP